MLWMVGPLLCDTFPFEVGGVERDHAADFVDHDVIGVIKPPEAVGPGEDIIELSGKLLPFHLGGLSELALAHQLTDEQQPLFVMRGDGGFGGWYTLRRVRETHKVIGPGGVGFEVAYSLHLHRCPPGGSSAGASLIGTLAGVVSSLFG